MHISITEVAIVAGVLVYVIAQVKDFRPIRALRVENGELRRDVDALREENKELRDRYTALEHRYESLEKSRDFQSSFDVIVKGMDLMSEKLLESLKAHEQREEQAFIEISRGLAANTTALAALAAGIHAGT